MRWRHTGAWLWPAFVALTVLDGVIGHAIPPAGTTETLVAAMLLGLVINVIAVVLLSRPLGMVLRRVRGDMPGVVARNYAGTAVVFAVTAVITIVGLAHRPQIQAPQRAVDIAPRPGVDRRPTPEQFRRNLQPVSLLAIEPGTIYRACMPSASSSRSYCVIVDRDLPFPTSVKFSGYEPNSVLDAGAG
jgi:hypothetical protein